MSDTDAGSCNDTEKPPGHIKELLNKIWEKMEEEKIERERVRRETKERQETYRKKDKERLEQLIRQIREDVEKMKESLFKKREERENKLVADISNPERKTQLSFVEINKLQRVEEVQCQRMSENINNVLKIVCLCLGLNWLKSWKVRLPKILH